MRTRIRTAGLIGLGAFGFLLLLASGSSADIADVRSPYQPAAMELVAPDGEAVLVGSAEVEGSAPAKAFAPPPRPMPESIVRAVPEAERSVTPVPADGPVERVRGVFRGAGSFLVDVMSACKVGLAGGAGGPALLFAVLGMSLVLTGRRTLGVRVLGDEEPRELLYAWDVIAPG